MALFEIDVLGFIAKLKHETKLFEWVGLIFQMGVSLLGTFCVVGGGALITTRSWAFGVGTGMVACAAILGVFVRRHPLLRGMMFVFPAEEAKVEINTDVQIISRSE